MAQARPAQYLASDRCLRVPMAVLRLLWLTGCRARAQAFGIQAAQYESQHAIQVIMLLLLLGVLGKTCTGAGVGYR